jgi:hypothetical protein
MLHMSAAPCVRLHCRGALFVGDFHGYHFEELGYYVKRIEDLELASTMCDAMYSGRYPLKYCCTCRTFRYWPFAFPSEEMIEALQFNGPWSNYPVYARNLPAPQREHGFRGCCPRPYRPEVWEQGRCLKCLEVLGNAISESEWMKYDNEIDSAENEQRYDNMKGLKVPSQRRYDREWWLPRLASQLEILKNHESQVRHETARRFAQAAIGFDLQSWLSKN